MVLVDVKESKYVYTITTPVLVKTNQTRTKN